ncbi:MULTISPECIES: hypothetical protein [unclassified Nocardia]|uniref:hypothetical protein n=1 Tax=unclassified Nocardia TaxID=2637762 RepID=UPI001CE3CCEC|nr:MULTISPECIES: hypothetical protein [unclassified Nocardia]
MPAIAATGLSTAYGSGIHAGVGIGPSGGVIPVIGAVNSITANTTALAAATSPTPPHRSLTAPAVTGALLLIPALIMGAFIAVAASLNTSDGHRAPIVFWLMLCVFTMGPFVVPALIAFVVMARRIAANARLTRGLPAASALWSTAFYCHRCGLCFWPCPPAAGITAGPMSPHAFQQILWNTGRAAGARRSGLRSHFVTGARAVGAQQGR